MDYFKSGGEDWKEVSTLSNMNSNIPPIQGNNAFHLHTFYLFQSIHVLTFTIGVRKKLSKGTTKGRTTAV